MVRTSQPSAPSAAKLAASRSTLRLSFVCQNSSFDCGLSQLASISSIRHPPHKALSPGATSPGRPASAVTRASQKTLSYSPHDPAHPRGCSNQTFSLVRVARASPSTKLTPHRRARTRALTRVRMLQLLRFAPVKGHTDDSHSARFPRRRGIRCALSNDAFVTFASKPTKPTHPTPSRARAPVPTLPSSLERRYFFRGSSAGLT
jgi:hypothetical protein